MNFEDFTIPLEGHAACVSLVAPGLEGHSSSEETETSLGELNELLRTLGLHSVESFVQIRKQIDPAFMLGKGKLIEIADEAKRQGCELLVFDFELTATQVRNIKKLTGMAVADRCNIILEIFARHAKTKEAKIQIEISRLEYLLPRLSGLWSHFGKQKGGIGLKGEGEQQIELDRRLIRQRIKTLKERLKGVKESRKQQRKRRENQAITAALVGYTNAGKSSIMNQLCKVNVLAENKLFATLDSTFRMLNPDSRPPMILIDTVGFIQNLPSSLVEGFRTTLESAMEADLLIIVCDISDPNFRKHLDVTMDVLSELDVMDKEKIIVFNKRDQLNGPFQEKILSRPFRDSFVVSSRDASDMSGLRRYIIEYFLSKQDTFDVFVPYEDGPAHSQVNGKTNVVRERHHEKGIFYRIQIPDFMLHQLRLTPYLLAPDEFVWEEENLRN